MATSTSPASTTQSGGSTSQASSGGLTASEFTRQMAIQDIANNKMVIGGVLAVLVVLFLMRRRREKPTEKAGRELAHYIRKNATDIDDLRDTSEYTRILMPVVKPILLMALAQMEGRVQEQMPRLRKAIKSL